MLQNSNAAAAAAAAAATPSTAAAAAAAANNAAIAASSIQPKLVVIRRRPNQGFGFTLRHFIAYPPEDDAASWPQVSVKGSLSLRGVGTTRSRRESQAQEHRRRQPECARVGPRLPASSISHQLPCHFCFSQSGNAQRCRRYVSAKHAPLIQMASAAFFLLFAKPPEVCHMPQRACNGNSSRL